MSSPLSLYFSRLSQKKNDMPQIPLILISYHILTLKFHQSSREFKQLFRRYAINYIYKLEKCMARNKWYRIAVCNTTIAFCDA